MKIGSEWWWWLNNLYLFLLRRDLVLVFPFPSFLSPAMLTDTVTHTEKTMLPARF